MSELRGILERVKAGKLSAIKAEADVRQAAQDLAATLGITGPPGDLKELLSARAIHHTRKVSMKEDGVLYALDEDRLGVDLRSSNPESRNRFTCAHEIGHTFFVDRADSDWYRSFRIADGEIERPADSNAFEEQFCNQFAGELLLPTPYLRARLFRTDISWRTIFEISEDTKNSLTACALRSVQASLSRALLISWHPYNCGVSGADFRVAWQVASPSVKARIEVTAPLMKNTLLFKALTSASSERVTVGRLQLPLRTGELSEYYSESICVSRNTGTILTLCVLEPHAEVYGSLAQRWTRKSGEQLELFQ